MIGSKCRTGRRLHDIVCEIDAKGRSVSKIARNIPFALPQHHKDVGNSCFAHTIDEIMTNNFRTKLFGPWHPPKPDRVDFLAAWNR